MANMITYRTRTPSLFPETRFFEDFMRPFFTQTRENASFRVDVRDEGDKYLMEAELPGVNKDSIAIDLDDGVLTIGAEWNESKKDETNDNGYVISERRYGSVKRSFNVENIVEDEIDAAYQDGILTLTLPKKMPAKNEPKRIAIR